MKNLLILVVLLLAVSGCLPKKKEDPEPDLAGTYAVSQLVAGGSTYNLPSGGSSASVVVTRPADTQIDVKVNVTENGTTTTEPFGVLPIRKASGRDYEIYNPNNNARLGTINGTDFVLDFTGSDGQRFAITARK